MNLRPIGNNQTELDLGVYQILFSYRTPVAVVDTRTGNSYRTEKFWSKTTSKHINSWADYSGTKPQAFFDNLLTEVK